MVGCTVATGSQLGGTTGVSSITNTPRHLVAEQQSRKRLENTTVERKEQFGRGSKKNGLDVELFLRICDATLVKGNGDHSGVLARKYK